MSCARWIVPEGVALVSCENMQVGSEVREDGSAGATEPAVKTSWSTKVYKGISWNGMYTKEKMDQLEHQREPAGTSKGTSRNRSLEEAVGSSRTSWSDKLNQLERYEPAGSAKEKLDQLMR
ncbi:hypothetical protein F511_38851 [Dorcoceras hygrometricum]|uniref:Uncharacterized protein n=1 Tax=Dorcoceras hygrometricum TaxID=472368 RepID=A0A2Z7B5E4_9LAMI|nr:hypothetical protein F511_38851 [Dorcoceras hygrometricum]